MRKILLLLVVLCLAGEARADVIHLKNGRKITGKIIKDTGYPPRTISLAYRIETPHGTVTVKKNEVESIEYGDVNLQPPQTVRTPSVEEEMNYIISLAKLQKKNRRVFEEVSSILNEMLVTRSFTSKGTRFRTYDALKKKVNIYLWEMRRIHPPKKYRKSYRLLIEGVEAMRDALHWSQYDQWDKASLAMDRAEKKRKAYLKEIEEK